MDHNDNINEFIDNFNIWVDEENPEDKVTEADAKIISEQSTNNSRSQ